MPTARFEADFSGFISAIDQSKIALVNFNTGAQDVEKTLNAMTDQFSGRQLIQEASLMVVAIEKLGGVSTLTADELQTVGEKAQEAADKLRAMGSDVPAGIQKYADAAKDAAGSTDTWSQAVSLLQTGLGAIGVTASMSAVVEWIKGIAASAAEIENLSLRLQTTTSEVQKFQAVAEATGVPVNKMTSAMQTLEEKIGKGDTGLAKAFGDLGISMDALKDETPFEMFQQIATALDKVQNSAQRAEEARAIFGNGWKQMLPALSADLQKTTDDVTQMSGGTVEYFAGLNTRFSALMTSMKNAAANALHEEAQAFGDWSSDIEANLKITAKNMADVAQAAPWKPMSTDMKFLMDVGNSMTASLTDDLKVWDDWNKAVAAVDAQTADFHKTLDGLDGAVVESAESMLKLGVNAKDVQTYFQLSDAAMIALQKDLKDWGPVADAFQAAADATKNWHDRLNDLSGEVVEGTKYYLNLGLSVQQVSLIMQQSVKDVQAVKDGLKAQGDAALSIQKIWNDYTDIVGSGSETAYAKAGAAIDKWYAADLAKPQQSKTDTAQYYDAIAALDDAKWAHLATNRLAADKDSKTYVDNQAKQDADAYTFALARQDQYSQAHIDKLKDTADKSAAVANTWSTSMADGAKTGAAASAGSWLAAADSIGKSGASASQSWIAGQQAILDYSQISMKQQIAMTDQVTQAKIQAVSAQVAANQMTEQMAEQTINYLVSEAERYQHAWAGVMDQTVADYRHAVGQIQMGDIGEQQAMSAAVAEVDQTGLGQMMRSGTTSVDLMNQYQAAIEKAMADRGYSIGGTLTPAAQTAGYGGTSVNTTVNITSPLGTPSQISQAVSAALADALRRQGATIPTT